MNAAKWWIAAGMALVALTPPVRASHTLANEKIRPVISEAGALAGVDVDEALPFAAHPAPRGLPVVSTRLAVEAFREAPLRS